MAAYKINVKGMWFAEVDTESDSAISYKNVEKVAEAMTISINPQLAEGALFGDGKKVDSSSRKTSYEVSMQLTALPPRIKAYVEGVTITNGVESGKSTDEPNPFAFGYEVEKTNGETQKVWFLYGKAKPIEESVEQSSDNRVYSNDNIVISALEHKALNRYYTKIDSENTDVTEKMLEDFFKVVQTTDTIVTA